MAEGKQWSHGGEPAKAEACGIARKATTEMANVRAFKIPGVVCWFWPNDHDHHFHAEKSGEWEIKVNFLEAKENMVEVIWVKKKHIPSKYLKLICDFAEKYQEQLLIEWEQAVNHDG
jgi:hypothetical protein